MPKFKIKYGLGGGFGGCDSGDETIEECENEDEANKLAWTLACEYYEGYDGLHGLRDTDMIMEEDEVDSDEAYQIWEEEREDWIDYEVEEIKDDVLGSEIE